MTDTQIYIADKSGNKFFNTNCSVEYKLPVLASMQRHLQMANKFPHHYPFLDLESAKIVDESAIEFDMTDEELLQELMA